VRIPIACTLTSEAAHDRVEEWRRFFASSVTAIQRTSEQEIRLHLGATTHALGDAVDLAQREKRCCPFFEFSILVEATSLWLVVRVPPEAAAVLADFAGLLPRPLQALAES
jgi:MerR family copper efflux transcriptional regulator